jgi:hypothetical protein
LGGVVSGQQVENLPLNGRSWASLMALVAGAIDTGTGTASSIRSVGKANARRVWVQARAVPSDPIPHH